MDSGCWTNEGRGNVGAWRGEARWRLRWLMYVAAGKTVVTLQYVVYLIGQRAGADRM